MQMGLDVYAHLAVAKRTEEVKDKIGGEKLDSLMDKDCWIEYFEDGEYVGIVIVTRNLTRGEPALLQEASLLERLQKGKEKFKKLTKLDGDLLLLRDVSF